MSGPSDGLTVAPQTEPATSRLSPARTPTEPPRCARRRVGGARRVGARRPLARAPPCSWSPSWSSPKPSTAFPGNTPRPGTARPDRQRHRYRGNGPRGLHPGHERGGGRPPHEIGSARHRIRCAGICRGSRWVGPVGPQKRQPGTAGGDPARGPGPRPASSLGSGHRWASTSRGPAALHGGTATKGGDTKGSRLRPLLYLRPAPPALTVRSCPGAAVVGLGCRQPILLGPARLLLTGSSALSQCRCCWRTGTAWPEGGTL